MLLLQCYSHSSPAAYYFRVFGVAAWFTIARALARGRFVFRPIIVMTTVGPRARIGDSRWHLGARRLLYRRVKLSGLGLGLGCVRHIMQLLLELCHLRPAATGSSTQGAPHRLLYQPGPSHQREQTIHPRSQSRPASPTPRARESRIATHLCRLPRR